MWKKIETKSRKTSIAKTEKRRKKNKKNQRKRRQ